MSLVRDACAYSVDAFYCPLLIVAHARWPNDPRLLYEPLHHAVISVCVAPMCLLLSPSPFSLLLYTGVAHPLSEHAGWLAAQEGAPGPSVGEGEGEEALRAGKQQLCLCVSLSNRNSSATTRSIIGLLCPRSHVLEERQDDSNVFCLPHNPPISLRVSPSIYFYLSFALSLSSSLSLSLPPSLPPSFTLPHPSSSSIILSSHPLLP